MSGGGLTGKNLGELALLGAVGVATDGFGLAAAAPEAAGAAGAVGAAGAGAAGAGAAEAGAAGAAGAGAAGSGGLANLAASGAGAGAGAGAEAAGAGAGAAGAGTTGAGAAGANPSFLSTLGTNLTTPAVGATGTWGTGAGYGLAGQAAIGTGLGGLGYSALQAQKKQYGIPGVSTPDGPLQHLYGAGGVRGSNNPWQQTKQAATGGLMRQDANPNAPMAYNNAPAYNHPSSTPTPQPVMRFSNKGSVPNADATSFSANADWQLAMEQNAANQQAMQAELQAQSSPNQGFGLSSQPTPYAAGGGISSLGHYSDGGQMLKGPGDGMSDSIPATINNKQPARLANDEFVVPADVVSHIGNGSSDAGAKKLYDMMDRVRRARTGSPKQAKAIHPDRYMPG